MPRVQRGKVSVTFEAREAAGCGSLRLLRALDGTRILQAAAPTAPPCFGRWPRSSPLQTRGCSPLVIPKLLGSIQKIQVASLKDFLCSADWKPLSRCATAPPSGSKRTRKRYGLPANFPAMPRAPSQRGLSAQQTGEFSPQSVRFSIFPPLKVKNPAEKRFRWFKNRFGCAILGVKVPVWTGNRRA